MSEGKSPCPSAEALDAFAGPEWKAVADPDETGIGAHVEKCEACAEWVRNARFEREFALAASAKAFARDLTEPALPELPGYEIVREVSRGGQGIVFEAIQVRTRRRVALKILRQDHGLRRSQRARFEREIEIAAALHHPGIVAVYDSIALPRGRHALVLEFVEGRSLDQLVADCSRDRPHLKRCVELLAKVCDAIHYAHQRGVIHRDLKPSNILVDSAENPRILDFGVACWFGASAGVPARITLTGEFAGTLAYAAPEQVAGDHGAPDLRSDLYAIGVMLYQASVGGLPYDVQGSLDTVIRNIAGAPPVRPARGAIDQDLWIIVGKALAKEPDRRYQSGDAMASDLRRYLRGETIEARRDSRLYVLRKALLRHRYAAAGLVGALAGLAFVGFTLKSSNTRLEAALRTSNIERARALGAAGSRPEADALLWPELLRFDAGLENPEHSIFNGSPEERRALWAGVEMQAAQPCLAIVMVPELRITDVRWESDRVRTVSRDGVERAWSLTDLSLLSERKIVEGTVKDLKFAQTGDRFVARTQSEIQCIDPATRTILGRLSVDADAAIMMGFCAAGKVMAISRSGKGVDFHAVPSFETLASVRENVALHAPWFSPECDRAAIVTEDGRVRVYHLPGGEPIGERQVVAPELIARDPSAPDDPWTLTFSGSGEVVAIGRRRRVSVGRIGDRDLPPALLATVGNMVEPVFSASGRWLLTRSNQDSRIHVWQASSWTEFMSLPGHTGGPTFMSISPDERSILSVDTAGVMRLWAGPGSGWRQDLPDSAVAPHDLALHAESSTVWAACTDGTIAEWSLKDLAPPRLFRADPNCAYTVDFSSRCRILGAGGDLGRVSRFREGTQLLPDLDVQLGAPVVDLRFQPDGALLAACSKYSPLAIYSTADWSLVSKAELKIGRLATVRWSPDGSLLVVSGSDGTCQVLGIPGLQTCASWKAHAGVCRTAVFSPDGTLIATGGDDGTVRLWETGTWKLRGEIQISNDNIFCLAFHGDGHVLAVGDRSGRVTQVGVPEAKALASFAAGSPVMALKYDGPKLIVGTIDRPISVWDFGMLARCVRGDAPFWAKKLGQLPGMR
ncbi:MAG: protein kinase [Planctomycetes bacterium]|nr:protein kinase [Planctomycetota bacterium]